jgi:hypothetical protein
MGYVTYPYAKDRAFSLQKQTDKRTADYDNDYCNNPEDGKLIVQNLQYEHLLTLRCKINSCLTEISSLILLIRTTGCSP